MDCKITICFESPYWVGVIERHDESGFSVGKVVFGKEPSEGEVYLYWQDHYSEIQFSSPTHESHIAEASKNYKRTQRTLRKEMAAQGVSSKAHEAIRLLLEQNKKERKTISKQQAERDKERKFNAHLLKKKEKQKGH
jgi:hypothetical protein